MQELLAALPDWLGVYLLIVNVAAFAVYGADKRRAKQGRWRVPEKTLFLLAIVGGSVGPCWGCGPFTTRPGTGTSAMASRLFWWCSWRWRAGCGCAERASEEP